MRDGGQARGGDGRQGHDRQSGARRQPEQMQGPVRARGNELTIREGEVVERAVPGDEHDEAEQQRSRPREPRPVAASEKPGQHHGGEPEGGGTGPEKTRCPMEGHQHRRGQRGPRRAAPGRGPGRAGESGPAGRSRSSAPRSSPWRRWCSTAAGRAAPGWSAAPSPATRARGWPPRSTRGAAPIGVAGVTDDDEDLVGDRIEQRPQHGRAIFARQVSVDEIGQPDQRADDDPERLRRRAPVDQTADERHRERRAEVTWLAVTRMRVADVTGAAPNRQPRS